jgi:hypothetical protein
MALFRVRIPSLTQALLAKSSIRSKNRQAYFLNVNPVQTTR